MVPKSPSAWRQFAKKFHTTDLHSLKPEDLQSGSKVEPIQYAAFRVLWKIKPAKPFDDALFGGLEIGRARAMLNQSDGWKRYLDAVEQKLPPSAAMGPFGIALTTQRQVDKAMRAAGRPKIDNILPRTRFQTALAAAAASAEAHEAASSATATTTMSGGGLLPVSGGGGGGVGKSSSNFDSPTIVRSAPVKNPFGELFTPPRAGDVAAGADAAATARPVPFALTMTPMTPASNVALGANAFPDVDDESIVNKALVDLLQAVTMVAHEDGSVKRSVEWSTRRASFAVRSGARQLYVAQVDGQLANCTDETLGKRPPSKMVLEVKPTLRADTRHVKYQEAAQMVAWISDEHAPTLPLPSMGDKGTYR